jgi:hypothetical protein
MSYTGVRKCSIIKNHNNDYVLKCDCYDSSITINSNGGRNWHNDVQLYQNCSFKSRAELEKQLFKDFLDGNLHGSYGKFSSLNWHSCKVELPKEIDIKIKDKVAALIFKEKKIRKYK